MFMRFAILVCVALAGCARGPAFPGIGAQHEVAAARDFEESMRLQDELRRQERVARFDEAEETALKIKARDRAKAQRCAEYWRAADELDMRSQQFEQESQGVNVFKQMAAERSYAKDTAAIRNRMDPNLYLVCGGERREFPGHDRVENIERARDMVGMEWGGRDPLFVQPSQTFAVDSSFGREYSSRLQELPADVRALLMKFAPRMNEVQLAELAAKLERALEQISQARGADDPSASIVLERLSFLESWRGDFAAALRHQEAAFRIVEKAHGSQAPQLAWLLWQRAEILLHGGKAKESVEVSKRALAILERTQKSPPQYAAALNNLGVAWHHDGAIERAIEAYEKSLRVLDQSAARLTMEETLASTHAIPTVHSNLGLALWQRGDLDQAHRHFRVVQERTDAISDSNPEYSERGALEQAAKLGVETEAVITLERALAAKSLPGQGMALQMLLERKGAVLEEQTRTMTEFRKSANDASPQAPKRQGERKSLQSVAEEARRQLADATHGRRGDDADLLNEYQAALAQRAAIAQREAATGEEKGAQEQEAAKLDFRIQAMQQEIKHSERRPGVGPGSKAVAGPDPKALEKAIKEDRLEAFMDEYMKRAQADLQVSKQETRTERLAMLQRIQSRLPQGAVLLEMLRYRPFDPRAGLSDVGRWGAARYGAYVIQPDKPPAYVDYGEAAPIETLIAQFRKALARPVKNEVRELGRRLDALLLQPIRAQSSATRFMLAPEGMLNLLPYGALVDEHGRHLLERFSFNYLASGRDLLRSKEGSKPRSPAVVMADPAFDGEAAAGTGGQESAAPAGTARSRDHSGVKFDALPGTAAEAQALQRILPEAQVLTGTRASETALKRLHGPRILHIATHGFFLQDQGAAPVASGRSAVAPARENPMLRAGLALAGANRLPSSGDDDGVLTALEAAGLDLAGTKLVVLSACETGFGEVKNGEGVFGLRRAFAMAGAETMLMSLWQVEDEATKNLMVGYHRRIAQGEDRTEALRQAQLELLRDPKHSHPFFWASFISSGQDGALN